MSETTLIDVTFHDVGEGLAEAQIVAWLVAPGEPVAEDQAIVVISTDKANVELPAPTSGILREQTVPVGATVALGAVLGRIEAARAVPEPMPIAKPAEKQAPSQLDQTADEQRVPLSRVRLATARATAASWREVPHIVEFRQIDATQLERAHEVQRAYAVREGVRLTYLPFFVRAVAIALRKHPSFNARLDLDHEELVYRRQCHIGIATASQFGLTVPVLPDADRQSILQLARSLERLIDRAKRQAPAPGDRAEGTFTITNFGSYGTWLGTPIIRAPEVAIAGFGRVEPGVLAVDGVAVVRPILPISVATDHRVNDGVHLGAFVDALVDSLSEPSLMSDNNDRSDKDA